MRVLSISGFAPYWQRYPVNVLDLEEGPTIGGGEEAFMRTATELAARGHEVEAFHYGDGGIWQGVKFHGPGASLYPRLLERWDAVIGWSTIKHFAPVKRANPSTRTLLAQQLNDLWCQGDWGAVDYVVSPSFNHADQVRGWGWLGKRAVVHNGLDLELYANAPAWKDRPLDVGYWSSPDRGLHHLLKAWPAVREAIPQARLHVFYEIKRFLEMTNQYGIGQYGERGFELGRLISAAQADASIIFHGAVPRKKLARIQTRCRVQCYPYDPFAYCEGFCGSVNQGLTAGCLVMTTRKDALPSLYGGGCYWLEKDPLDVDFVPFLADQVIDGLRGDIPIPGKFLPFTWWQAGMEMEDVCKGEGWV